MIKIGIKIIKITDEEIHKLKKLKGENECL